MAITCWSSWKATGVMKGNLLHVLNEAHQASSSSLTPSWEDTGQGKMVLHSDIENCQEKPLPPG